MIRRLYGRSPEISRAEPALRLDFWRRTPLAQHNSHVYHWNMRLFRDPVSATKYGANAEDPERQRARAM